MRAPKLLFFILANLYRGSMYIIVDMRPQTTNRYSILYTTKTSRQKPKIRNSDQEQGS